MNAEFNKLKQSLIEKVDETLEKSEQNDKFTSSDVVTLMANMTSQYNDLKESIIQ